MRRTNPRFSFLPEQYAPFCTWRSSDDLRFTWKAIFGVDILHSWSDLAAAEDPLHDDYTAYRMVNGWVVLVRCDGWCSMTYPTPLQTNVPLAVMRAW